MAGRRDDTFGEKNRIGRTAGAGRCADTGRAAGAQERRWRRAAGIRQFPAYVEQLKRRAREQGISQSTLDRAFAQIHFVDRVIKADRNQPEQKVTTDDYLRRVMSPAKVRRGRELYRQRGRNGRAPASAIGCRGAISSRCGAWKAPTVRFRGGKTWCLRWRRWRLKGAARPFSAES